MSDPQAQIDRTRPVPSSSIWLVPADDWLAIFRDEIERIGRKLGTELFQPHVTVLGDIAVESDALRASFATLAGAPVPLELTVSDVEGMDLHFRALYLRMSDDPRFDELCRRAAAAVDGASSPSPYPHLSLAYGSIPPDVRMALCGDLRRRFRCARIPFDRLALVRASSMLPIPSWRVLEWLPATG